MFKELLEGMERDMEERGSRSGKDEPVSMSKEEQLEMISDLIGGLKEPLFKEGDVITQKNVGGKTRYRCPAIGSPAVVLKVFPPSFKPSEKGDNLIAEDMRIAVVTANNFVQFYEVESVCFDYYNK